MIELLEKIKQYQQIVILRHKNPDPDAIGSQCGLRELLRWNFPDKEIYATGYNEPTLDYLAQMDKPGQLDPKSSLVIVCDVANRPRIDGDFWQSADFLIKIDHHPNDDPYGDLQFVEPESSSTSEIITQIAFELGLELNAAAARLLYAGIVGDTGRFLYASTSSETFRLASELVKFPFNRVKLSRDMDSFPAKIARLHGYVYERLEITATGAARVVLPLQVLQAFEINDAETSSVVGLPGNISSVKSWAIFVEHPDGHYRVRMRSKAVPINEIAKRHDGGGHELASGANSYSLNENEQIWKELQTNLS